MEKLIKVVGFLIGIFFAILILYTWFYSSLLLLGKIGITFLYLLGIAAALTLANDS